MKETPIIVCTQLIPRVLDGSKTHIRRVIKAQHEVSRRKKSLPSEHAIRFTQSMNPQCWIEQLPVDLRLLYPNSQPTTINGASYRCPYGQVGDRLWVREAFYYDESAELREDGLFYKADEWMRKAVEDAMESWQSPIFMPRWASRITLEITNIRVERLQEISYKEEEAQKEGVDMYEDRLSFVAEFIDLWNSLNPKYPWESNPWVWVLEFTKV